MSIKSIFIRQKKKTNLLALIKIYLLFHIVIHSHYKVELLWKVFADERHSKIISNLKV